MPHLPVEAVEEGMEIRRLRAFRRSEDTCSVPEMAAWVMAAIPTAIGEIKRWKPDVIHAHFAVPTGAVAWVAHQFTGVPYVLTAHLGDVPGGVPEQTDHLFCYLSPFIAPIWKKAATTTAVSSFVADLAQKAYGMTPQIILNGMKLPSPSVLVTHAPPRLIMVGRMSVQKNPLVAVQALGLIKDLPWHCTLIGDGPLLAQVREDADRLGLSERIEFRGWASATEVSEAMRQSEILLMPSLSEGLPMVAIEALANGLALVGSRIGGLADVTQEGTSGNARLFDLTEGAEGMAGALKSYLLDPEGLYSARTASLAMAQRFDLEESVEAYEKVLLGVCR
jgi:glycosyltransferase involved in cell wall biosynthesis